MTSPNSRTTFIEFIKAVRLGTKRLNAGNYEVGGLLGADAMGFTSWMVLATMQSQVVSVDELDIMTSPVSRRQYAEGCMYACLFAGTREQFWLPMGWNSLLEGLENVADDLPVTGVSWDQASTFAELFGATLPKETEWEIIAKNWKEAASSMSASRTQHMRDQYDRHIAGVTRYGKFYSAIEVLLRQSYDWQGCGDSFRIFSPFVAEWCVEEFIDPEHLGSEGDSEGVNGDSAPEADKVVRGLLGQWSPDAIYARFGARASERYAMATFRCVWRH